MTKYESDCHTNPYSHLETSLGRFRRNKPIALTLMARLPEKFIIVSPIMVPRPQNHSLFKCLYIYIYIYIYMWVFFLWCISYRRFAIIIAIRTLLTAARNS